MPDICGVAGRCRRMVVIGAEERIFTAEVPRLGLEAERYPTRRIRSSMSYGGFPGLYLNDRSGDGRRPRPVRSL